VDARHKAGHDESELAAPSLHRLRKPEPLRENFKAWWSRRITDEHRLVYRVTGAAAAQTIEIAQCRFLHK
jgi:Txe/YoeB family toxin of toxin-antitoxin system